MELIEAAPAADDPKDAAHTEDTKQAAPTEASAAPVKMEIDSAAITSAPADAKTPAPAIKTSADTNKAPASGPSPPSGGPTTGKAKARATQPISSLNPYVHGWAIRAKVVSKGPKRTFNRAGAPSSVFSAELVDEQGTSIEGTFWREAADKYYDTLEDGKVYVFARGSVKPANKNYNRTRNAYCLNFDASAEVKACEGDIDTSAMTARMDFVAIEQLAAFVDKKAPVDIIGVVTAAGQLGSVKRKTDASEIQRRDITLVDQG